MRSNGSGEVARVAVIGLGYVGCVTAACLAKLDHEVIGVDRDPHKVSSIHEGRAPFFEPGLPELVREGVASGRLRASTEVAGVLAESDVALICVGTPSEKNGNLGLEQLRRVSQEIRQGLDGRDRSRAPLIVAVRSTVFPGTCEDVVMECLRGCRATVVANPEFLREGSAVRDFLEPSLLVVGGSEPAAVERVAGLYVSLPVTPCLVSLRTAEMIKYACNAFHAVKIGFANEIGTLCANLAIPADEVMQTLCQDTTLNISPAYLKPGFAFGGSCLPKDLRALAYRANRLDLELPLLESVLPSNARHLERGIQAVLDLPSERLGIFGLAFKENTDDLRESPVVTVIEQLIGKGRNIRIFDPHIQLDQIYGSNQQFLIKAIPHVGRLMASDLESLLSWAEHLVIAQKPSDLYRRQMQLSGLPALDLTSVECMRAAGSLAPSHP
jgi:GDP-mannose 6-dehydrogenase